MVHSDHYDREGEIGETALRTRFGDVFPQLGAVPATVYMCKHCEQPFPVPLLGAAAGRQAQK